jgi:hypothetical protein
MNGRSMPCQPAERLGGLQDFDLPFGVRFVFFSILLVLSHSCFNSFFVLTSTFAYNRGHHTRAISATCISDQTAREGADKPMRRTLSLTLLIAAFTGITAYAQKGQGSGQSAASSGAGSGSGLAGIAYAPDGVPTAAPTDARILCFDLVHVSNNPAQPFILQPAAKPSVFGGKCSQFDDQHPIMAGEKIAIGINAKEVDPNRDRPLLLALSLNVTTQAGLTLNASPVRPSLTTTAANVASNGPLPNLFYLTWPNKLNGDTIPSVAVSALYHTPLPVAAQKTDPAPLDSKGNLITQPVTITTTDTVPWPDQVFQLLSLTLPQVHPKYYFNVSTGVVASFLHNPSFTRVALPPATGTGAPTSYTTQETKGNYLVNPVILFSAYLRPMDAERPWNAKDLTPAPCVGFSLTSPATSFFFGATMEVRRNVQIAAGVNLAKVTALTPTGYVDPASSTAPATQQVFHPGAFVGMTVNISFITSLFGGSKSSGN